MPKLEPCPLCGGKARYTLCGGIGAHGCGEFVGEVECTGCGLLYDTPSCETPEEAELCAYSRWNNRDERTCRVVTTRRSFSQTQDRISKKCSECGYVFGSVEVRPLFPGFGEMIEIGSVDIPNYCPQCGTKVMKG